MPFVRVNCGVNNKGDLIPIEEVDDFIRSKKDKVTKDWYVSPYLYDEEAVTYWASNGKSLKGFQGRAWTDHLYWDLDRKGDSTTLDFVRNETIKLVDYLAAQGLSDGLEVYFSGNKGFHVILRTEDTFVREELTLVASGIIKAAGVSTNCFDTSVYNTTRILRYPLTVHQESQLFKIPLDWDQLTGPVEGILSLAETSQPLQPAIENVSVAGLKTKLTDKSISTISAQDLTAKDVLAGLGSIAYDNNGQPIRRCVEAIQKGDFGPGERHGALMRLAAYHQGRGVSREELEAIFEETLALRAELHPTAGAPDSEDNKQILNSVYAPGWQGGMFTCKTDSYLQSKCEHNGHHCWEERRKTEILGKGVGQIGSLIKTYVEYGDEAHEEYPKFGLLKLDKEIRIRPKNYSILAGASGSGKTSAIFMAFDSLNEQKIPHLFFSLDMADTSVFEKLAARHTPYSLSQVEKAFSKHTRDTRLIEEISQQLAEKLPYTYFDFTSSASMEYIEQTVLSLNRDLKTNPVKVIFIDYAGRLAGGGDSAYAKATANSLKANDVAKSTNTHIMFLAQVARESGDLTTPLLSARVAKESGSWEENATFVITCWRPFGDNSASPDNVMAMYIGKNRSNSLKEMHFYWEGKTGTIRDMTPVEYDGYVKECEKHKLRKPPNGDHPLGISHQVDPAKTSSRLRKSTPDETKQSAIAEGKLNATKAPRADVTSDAIADDFEEELSDFEYRGRSTTFRTRD